ncbi:Uncharacterized RNA methyltransferase [Galdieria sulphuraria]|nr:Uncharacterized RNA methyltransferase [Galdieria sulphuraria]
MTRGSSLTFIPIALTLNRERSEDLKGHRRRRRPSSLFLSPIFKGEICRSCRVLHGARSNLQETEKRQENCKVTSVSDTLDCQHFSFCDGCLLAQSLTTPPCSKKIEEYFWKQKVRVLFHSDTPVHGWRSVARLAVRRDDKGRTRIGLFKEDSHSVVEIPHCRVHHPLINGEMETVKKAMKETGVSGYDEDREEGQLRYIQMSVEHRSQTLQAAFVWHAPRLKEAEFSILISQAGFCTVSNIEMLKELVKEISKYIEPRTKVLEFYAGVGAIGIPVAYLSEAYLKATWALTPSQRHNAEFFIGTAAAHLDKLRFSEVIIVDPPRSGMDYALAARLSSVRDNDIIKRIIYVSCKFESLQRDLEIIQRNGKWTLRKAEAFLFFPGTDHWELLCVLDRKV